MRLRSLFEGFIINFTNKNLLFVYRNGKNVQKNIINKRERKVKNVDI